MKTAKKTTPILCSVDGCTRSAKEPGAARGFCGTHYQRVRRHGVNTTVIATDLGPSTQVSFTLPTVLLKQLDDSAKGQNMNRADALRSAVTMWLEGWG